MDKIIIKKESKAISGPILIMILLFALILVCYLRLLNYKKYSITINALLICLMVVCLFYLIKEIISLISFIKMPKNLIEIENEIINLYCDKKHHTINKSDVTICTKGSLYNNKILFYQATIIIRTNERSYSIKYVKDLKRSITLLDDYFMLDR